MWSLEVGGYAASGAMQLRLRTFQAKPGATHGTTGGHGTVVMGDDGCLQVAGEDLLALVNCWVDGWMG